MSLRVWVLKWRQKYLSQFEFGALSHVYLNAAIPFPASLHSSVWSSEWRRKGWFVILETFVFKYGKSETCASFMGFSLKANLMGACAKGPAQWGPQPSLCSLSFSPAVCSILWSSPPPPLKQGSYCIFRKVVCPLEIRTDFGPPPKKNSAYTLSLLQPTPTLVPEDAPRRTKASTRSCPSPVLLG